MMQAEKSAAADSKAASAESLAAFLTAKEHAGMSYSLIGNEDILIRNGKFANRKVSELVRTVEGRDFIGRIWRTASDEMKEIIRRYFSE